MLKLAVWQQSLCGHMQPSNSSPVNAWLRYLEVDGLKTLLAPGVGMCCGSCVAIFTNLGELLVLSCGWPRCTGKLRFAEERSLQLVWIQT